ncbi:MAG: 23S rRNA (adenine(2503)-C(2))-methyltransferase RlmN [Polyangiaceae bacterium]|nr:23S rRNA (adenine(2503)-C(2))-methyltransferase RlmN [Polyangiaceae bacterium]
MLPPERPVLFPRPPGARRGLPARDVALLSALPATELSDLLVRSGGSPTQAHATTAKVVRYVLGGDVGFGALDPRWDELTLQALGIGAWAHGALLGLSARASLELAERAPASDGSERLLLSAGDGALVETVIIPGPGRTTVCISSQVGCARACSFCETGALGLERQLDAAEIVDQIRVARALWGSKSPPIQNVVFMGMGEPFDNLAEVARATHILTDDRGLKLSPSRVTVSTVGVADKLEAFFRTCRAELAVSLNAPDDARRSAIMPVNERFPLATLIDALRTHTPRGHKVLFEYVLIGGFNDARADADLVADLVAPVRCRVNVIPVNPGPDPAHRAPTPEAMNQFVARLAERGVTTLVRRPRGRDVGGACGQLAGAARARGSLPLA